MSFQDMLEHLDDAISDVKEAQASVLPSSKIKNSEAYILGSLKAALAVLQSSRSIVKDALDSQIKSKADSKPESPPQLHD